MKNDKKILMKELYSCWKDSPFPSVKVTSYFPAYVELFGHLVGEKCTFIETGILDGGSLFMWRNWLGENARIIGIDLNPEALKWQNEGFEIFIGDQADPEFWKITYKNIGNFDALLDDGGHQSFQQIITTLESIRACNSNCVVVSGFNVNSTKYFSISFFDLYFLSNFIYLSQCLIYLISSIVDINLTFDSIFKSCVIILSKSIKIIRENIFNIIIKENLLY